MSDAAAESAARADRKMPNVPRHPRQNCGEGTMANRCLETGVPGKRANAQLARLLPHIIERIDAIDVNEARGTGEPKIHRRHEALSAGKDLSFLTMRGEEIDRIFNGAGREVFKRDGFHEGRAEPKQYLSFTLNDLPDKSSCKREAIAHA